VDVDVEGEWGARPAHYCAAYDRVAYWQMILRCRPSKDFLASEETWLDPIRALRRKPKFPV
jgi:hypothetical protein